MNYIWELLHIEVFIAMNIQEMGFSLLWITYYAWLHFLLRNEGYQQNCRVVIFIPLMSTGCVNKGWVISNEKLNKTKDSLIPLNMIQAYAIWE